MVDFADMPAEDILASAVALVNGIDGDQATVTGTLTMALCCQIAVMEDECRPAAIERLVGLLRTAPWPSLRKVLSYDGRDALG